MPTEVAASVVRHKVDVTSVIAHLLGGSPRRNAEKLLHRLAGTRCVSMRTYYTLDARTKMPFGLLGASEEISSTSNTTTSDVIGVLAKVVLTTFRLEAGL
jgi:hypothetical protein